MNGKKIVIADAVAIFVFAAIIIASGIYIIRAYDPLAIFYDGTLENSGAAGLVLLLTLGGLLFLLKLAMYSLLGAGIIFLCEGLTVLYCIINNVSARRFKIWLNICNFLCANILLIAFIVIFIAIRAAIDGEISVSVPLAVMAALATAIGLASLILNIKALKY